MSDDVEQQQQFNNELSLHDQTAAGNVPDDIVARSPVMGRV